MPTPATARMLPPKSPDEFEDMAVDAMRVYLKSPRIRRNGRNGQRQGGVDALVFGTRNGAGAIAIQAKNVVAPTLKLVRSELARLDAAQKAIAEYYILVASSRDSRLDASVRAISAERKGRGLSTIEILFWDDVCDLLCSDPKLTRKYYPPWPTIRSTGNKGIDGTRQVLDALAIHQIRTIRDGLRRQPGWTGASDAVLALAPYADPLRYGAAVALEYLETLRVVTNRTRDQRGEPLAEVNDIACEVATAIEEVLPIHSLVRRAARTPSPAEIRVLRYAVTLGFDLAYDGAAHLRELVVVDAGVNVLWTVLRFARVNRIGPLADAAEREFEEVKEAARRAVGGAFDDAADWIEFKRLDANDDLSGEPTPMPERIEARIDGDRHASLERKAGEQSGRR